ncbi:hypothetical protein ABTX81_27840 [Kitasatospora sp. NPDC097605]|uniref:hypothetical protein n=1 Tax=Kitasatospora sp. NPDC097605 TaxID=3157226 RepID=UPI0033297748
MPYDTGARVKLTRDVPVTAVGAVTTGGFPGALYLAEGLAGVVTGVTKGGGGTAEDMLASFDQQIRDSHLPGFSAALVDDLRQQFIQRGAFATGIGTPTRYKVRFENGFVLDGLEENWLAAA